MGINSPEFNNTSPRTIMLEEFMAKGFHESIVGPKILNSQRKFHLHLQVEG